MLQFGNGYRYHHGISMSELYHMSDAIEIVDRDVNGRMVALIGSQLTTSPAEDEVCALAFWYFSYLYILLHPLFISEIISDVTFICCLLTVCLPSVLWCCWLGGRKGIRPVKTEQWGAGVVVCLERGADLHMAQLMPLPLTVSCFSKIQIGFTFLVPSHPGSPRQRAIKQVCECVSVIIQQSCLY